MYRLSRSGFGVEVMDMGQHTHLIVGSWIGILLLAGCGEDAPPAALMAPQGPPKVENVRAVSVERPRPEPGAQLTSVAPSAALPTPVVPSEPPAPTVPSDGSESGLSVQRLVFASGVEDREPVGASESFAEKAGPVYAFLELVNVSAGENEISVEWQPLGVEGVRAGEVRGLVSLHVGASPRWRTWALTRTLKAGDWECIVRDASGIELARGTVHIDE